MFCLNESLCAIKRFSSLYDPGGDYCCNRSVLFPLWLDFFVGNDADIQLNEQGVLTISKDNISCNYVTTDSKVLEDICSVNSKGLDAIRHNSEKIAEFDFNELPT